MSELRGRGPGGRRGGIDAAPPLPIVDAHLDLAENVTFFGRDYTLSAAEIRQREQRTRRQAMVSLPDLERGGIAVVGATVTPGFLVADVGADFEPRSALYRTPEEAEAHALDQIALYEAWQTQGRIRLLTSAPELDRHLDLWRQDRKPGLVLLMEGADPIVRVGDLPAWWRRGLRMIGLTYGDTAYGCGVAGGHETFRTGGLTPAGISLLEAMAAQGFIWDVSHLTEAGIRQGLTLNGLRVCASHANAQALTPTDRHLSDPIIRAIAARDGVIGLVLYNGFLESRWRKDRSIRVSVREHLARHAAHMARLVGWNHIGIGSDLDGGFGLEESPVEIETVADLEKVDGAVPAEAREAVLSTNWLDFLRSALPEGAP
jgi:membrane dipeptidase